MTAPSHRRAFLACLVLALGYSAIVSFVLAARIEARRWGFMLSDYELTAARHALHVHAALALVAGGLLLASRRWRMDHPLPPRLFLVLAPFILLGSADRILAIYFQPLRETEGLYVSHPTRGWAGRPGWTGSYHDVLVRINQDGLRGREIPVEKEPGERRILFLGDSIVFGWGVARDDTLVTQVRQLAAARSGAPRVSAINCSTSAYSPWQQFDLLVNDCMRFAPDVIVHVFCLNDVLEKFQLYQFGGYARGFEPRRQALLEWSGLYRAIRAAGGGMPLPSGEQIWRQRHRYSVRRLLREPETDDVQRGWEMTLENLAEIVSVARDHSTPIVIVCAPHRSQLGTNAPSAPPPQDVLEEFARDQDVPYLDLLPAFRSYAESEDIDPTTLFIDRLHFSPAGHALAAEAIARFLSEKGLLSF